ncbi:MAG: hutG [Thermoleophilia bacterium]|nr:hutG [Thermoleophilia bacterium]MCZ4497086.1 hutG [Thermoleophilia bacterium]
MTRNAPGREPWILRAADVEADGRPILAELLGADYSARAITAQRSDTAPDVVRQALARIAPWDARSQLDLARWCIADHGNAGAIGAPTWEEAVRLIRRRADEAFASERFVIALGGDHSVTWPLAESAAAAARVRHGQEARLGIIQLDIHHDVRPLDHGPSNGTPFRGLLETGVVRGDDLVQVGIHPFANRRHLTEYCDEQRIRRFDLDEVAQLGPEATATAALSALSGVHAIHLSIDIDVLDRASAPGTAAALPGGLDPRTLQGIIEGVCADPRVASIDVVEFDPERDVADTTALNVALAIVAAVASLARRTMPPL